jgi:hypothetical protein
MKLGGLGVGVWIDAVNSQQLRSSCFIDLTLSIAGGWRRLFPATQRCGGATHARPAQRSGHSARCTRGPSLPLVLHRWRGARMHSVYTSYTVLRNALPMPCQAVQVKRQFQSRPLNLRIQGVRLVRFTQSKMYDATYCVLSPQGEVAAS